MSLFLLLSLLSTLIAALAIQPAFAQPPTGMVSCWKFDEGAGGTALDSVGSNDGTIYGATWTNGIVGSALSFDGDDYVDCGNDTSLMITDVISIEVCIKWNKEDLEWYSGIVAKGDNFTEQSYCLQTHPDGYLAFAYSPTPDNPCAGLGSNTVVGDDRWHHIVFILDTNNGVAKIYIDGRLDAENSDLPKGEPMPTTEGPVTIGVSLYFPEYFQGVIDEVAIYNRALTTEEIKEHYQSLMLPPGIISFWKFDEGAGDIAYDSVGPNNGTLINGVNWTTGICDSAISFRHRSVGGVFEHVSVPDDGTSNLNLVNEATIEFWILPTAEAQTQFGLIFGKGDFGGILGGGNWWGTNIDNETGITTQLQWYSEPAELLFTPGILQVDEWQHITWRFDHGNMSVYRNGQLYGEAQFLRDYLPDVTGLPFMFGFTEDWHATYFDLDEFAVYNRALTEEEIQWRYTLFQPTEEMNVVWLEYNTGYRYSTKEDFVTNDMLEGRRGGYSSVHNSEDGTGLNFNEPTLNLELAEGLEAERWSEEWWVKDTQYIWEFPDLEECQGAGADVEIAGTFQFNPGYEVSRTLNPEIITYPGGEQEFTFTFTPIDETLNWAHFHFGVPEGEVFDAIITSPTTDPDKMIWLSEDQRYLWIQIGLGSSGDFHPYTFTVKIQVTLTDNVAIKFVPTLHVDARTYSQEFEIIGSSPPPANTEIGTWTWSSSGEYLWRWHESLSRGVALDGYWEEVVPPRIVSYWKFDEGAGDIAFDCIGANHGTIDGAAWTTGIVGSALSFDGDDYVDCGNDPSLMITDVISIEVWIKGTWNGYSGIVARGDEAFVKQSFLLQTQPDGLVEITYSHASDGNDYLWSNTVVGDDRWHHVVAIIDTINGVERIFIDGRIDAQKDTKAGEPMVTTMSSVTIGVSSNIFPEEFFRGIIDEVAIYNRALTEEEILQHYNNGLMRAWARALSVKLSGEFDYLQYEKVKIRLAALVTEAITGELVSGASVTLDIYDENGELLVSAPMVERLAGTGIYEWESPKTIRSLMVLRKIEKGVYLAHVRASFQGANAHDILEFHIDPPPEEPNTTLIIAIIALLAAVVTPLILLKQPIKRLLRSRRQNDRL